MNLRRLPTDRIRRRAYALLLLDEVAEAYSLMLDLDAIRYPKGVRERPRGVVREMTLEARAVFSRAMARSGATLNEIDRALGATAAGASRSNHYVKRVHLDDDGRAVLEALPVWNPDEWSVEPCPGDDDLECQGARCEVCGGLYGVATRVEPAARLRAVS